MILRFLILFVFINYSSIINAQGLIAGTYHSDGSITTKDGEVIRKSYADRYQEALKAYNNGEKVNDWPTVKKNKKGKSFGKKGFFGEGILKEGAPLLAIDKVTGSKDEILNNIAKQNGYVNEDILKLALVANSSEDFKIENNMTGETISSLEDTYDKLVDEGVIGENFADFDNISDIITSLSGIDPETGNAILAPEDGPISGDLIADQDISIGGIDPGASLANIAESLNLDSSLVTSNAMADTLSQMGSKVSEQVSSSLSHSVQL